MRSSSSTRGLVVLGSFGIVATLLCSGCGVETGGSTQEVAVHAQGLSMQRTTTSIEGNFSFSGRDISFVSRAKGPDAMELRMSVGAKNLDLDVDIKQGVMRSDGHDNVLDSSDREALAAFGETLGRELAAGEFQAHELLASAEAEYWSTAPEGFVHKAREVRSSIKLISDDSARERAVSMGLGDNGITCIRKGTWYNAYYDTSSGSAWYQSTQCNANWGTSACGSGDYNCMGRCGAGCGWGAPSSYTLDCLEHDVCSHNLCASGGSADPNCGDEYDESQDDWTFGVMWGCWG